VKKSEQVRWEKVIEARRRIARGDYDRPGVLEVLADRLLRALVQAK